MSENLTMVTVHIDYPDHARPTDTRYESFWQGSEEERTFYAYRSGSYWRLVAPSDGSEPRSRGFYRDSGDPEGHHGWNVEPQYATVLDAPEESTTAPEEAPLTFGDLAVGELWQSAGTHPSDGPWIKLPDSRYVQVGHPSVGSTIHDGYPVKRYVLPSGDVTPEREEEIRRDQRNKDLAQFQEWKDEATRVAHEYAANNGLCSEFDRAMREIGLPDRSEYTPPENEYRVTLTFNVSAPDGNEAFDRVYGTLDTDTGYTLIHGTPSNESISSVQYDVETVVD